MSEKWMRPKILLLIYVNVVFHWVQYQFGGLCAYQKALNVSKRHIWNLSNHMWEHIPATSRIDWKVPTEKARGPSNTFGPRHHWHHQSIERQNHHHWHLFLQWTPLWTDQQWHCLVLAVHPMLPFLPDDILSSNDFGLEGHHDLQRPMGQWSDGWGNQLDI